MFIQAGAGLRTNFNIFIQKMYQDKKNYLVPGLIEYMHVWLFWHVPISLYKDNVTAVFLYLSSLYALKMLTFLFVSGIYRYLLLGEVFLTDNMLLSVMQCISEKAYRYIYLFCKYKEIGNISFQFLT